MTMKKKSNNFGTNWRNGTYKCCSCGELTRDTGEGEGDIDLCLFCYDESGFYNMVQDDYKTEEEYQEFLDELCKKHGRDRKTFKKIKKKVTKTLYTDEERVILRDMACRITHRTGQ
jgi:hypothetical protein